MRILEAHGRFGIRDDGGLSVLPAELQPLRTDLIDTTPAVATAAVSLTGWLADCETDRDLDEAAAHFASCFAAGVFTVEQLNQEAVRIIGRVLAHPDCVLTELLANQ